MESQTALSRDNVRWSSVGTILMAALFVAVFFWLTNRQYQRFDLVAPDVATFGQAIWNTLRGRFLYSTVIERSILGYHFSPAMAALAPLLLLWDDIRILFLAQTVAIAVSGLILYRLVRREHPPLAPWFLLAFYLNPALHLVAIQELRRVIFAMPFLALALYTLQTRRYRLMALALFAALLFKEDIGLIVMAFGLYLLFFHREWGWGALLAVGGFGWALVATFWIVPALGPDGQYGQIGHYAPWGDSAGELLTVFFRRPGDVLAWIFEPGALRALVRIFLPLGLILPLLAADVAFLAAPSLLLALLSHYQPMHRLEDWYMAPLLPFLAGAVAVGLGRLSRPAATRAVASLLFSTLAGFLLFSQAPLGGQFSMSEYRLTPHHRLAAEMVEAVPPGAAVVAQDAYLGHLTQRQELRIFPWAGPEDPVDYYLLDRHLPSYPLSAQDMKWEIENMIADPALTVRFEGDDAYLFQRNGEPLPGFDLGAVAEETMLLERVEVAVAAPESAFEPVAVAPASVSAGETVRVYLYWRALAKPPGERTVSVRLMRPDGQIVVQHDMQPSSGARPTSWWEPGWYFRDVYALTIPEGTPPGPATLAVTLYDTYTQEPVPFASGEVVLPLLPVQIEPDAPGL